VASAACIDGLLDGAAVPIGRAARRRIEADFGLSRMVRQYEALYLGNPSD